MSVHCASAGANTIPKLTVVVSLPGHGRPSSVGIVHSRRGTVMFARRPWRQVGSGVLQPSATLHSRSGRQNGDGAHATLPRPSVQPGPPSRHTGAPRVANCATQVASPSVAGAVLASNTSWSHSNG